MIKQVAKGLITFIPGAYSLLSRKRTGGTDSARYCYSVWLRHLATADRNGLPTHPKTVAELGPGDSLGIGLAALISGVERYYAFDVVKYSSIRKNLAIFDAMITLFRNRDAIPNDEEFPEVEPSLTSYDFPRHILTDDRLGIALADRRLQLVRESIRNMNGSCSLIQYKVPWNDVAILAAGSVDMIFSQAVLEHIDDLAGAYTKMHSWLKPNGVMSHAIDFKSHGTSAEWNGHWVYPDWVWKIIRGKRTYLINRAPHSEHIRLLNARGYKMVCDIKRARPSRIAKKNLAARFRAMDQADLTTSSTFIQCLKARDVEGVSQI